MVNQSIKQIAVATKIEQIQGNGIEWREVRVRMEQRNLCRWLL